VPCGIQAFDYLEAVRDEPPFSGASPQSLDGLANLHHYVRKAFTKSFTVGSGQPAPATEAKGCHGETPLTDAMREQVAGKATSLIEMTNFARDLERKLGEARTALERAAKLPTHQDCPVENHGVVVAAMEALARIDAGNNPTHTRL